MYMNHHYHLAGDYYYNNTTTKEKHRGNTKIEEKCVSNKK